MDYTINYPNGIDTSKQRYDYLYKLQLKILEDEHNQKGKDYTEGKITLTEWTNYKNNRFNPYSQLMSDEICHYRNLIKNDAKNNALINASLDDITVVI